jgi:hypothetical protein
MGRTLVQLTPQQQEALRRRSEEEHVSVSELIRRAVDASLTVPTVSEAQRKRALAAAGSLRSDQGDVVDRHNEIYVEAVLGE